MTPELHQIHDKAKLLAQRFRQSEKDLFEILIEIENLSAYLPLGYSSLFEYCVGYLNLTRDQSYAHKAIAKKSESVPELLAAVRNEEMTFSNARKLVSVITPENKDAWLEKGKELSQHKLEREIAKEKPRDVIESLRPVSENESELRVGFDAEMEEDLKRIKALLGTGSIKQALKAVMRDYVKRRDPVEKAQREKPVAIPARKAAPILGARRNIASRYIPRQELHQVRRRDQGGCQFKGLDGRLCGQTHRVQIHHLESWAFGGTHEANNLMTLCQKHHRYWHEAKK